MASIGASIWRIIAISSLLSLSIGCGGTHPDAKQAQSASADPPSVLVTVVPVQRAPIANTLLAYGTVNFSPEGAHVMTVQAEEVVAQLLVAVGQPVEKGEQLLTLEPSANAHLELDKARIDVEFDRREVQRLTDLRTRQLATNAEVQTAEKTLATAEAALASTSKRYNAGEPHVVQADVAGTVQVVNVQLGQLVPPGAPLVTIGNRDRLRVELGVEQDDLPQLHIGQRVDVRPINAADTPISSRIGQLYQQIDPTTRLAKAVIPLPSAHGLLPGAVIRADIVLAANPHALVVPRSAVLYQQGKPYVFLADHGHARERFVETGVDNGTVIEIRQGLAPAQQVVTVGNAELRDGMAVRTEPRQ